MSRELLGEQQISDALTELHSDWTVSDAALRRSIEFADFLTAVAFIDQVAPACERANHHPDLGLHWRRVDVVLSTHSAGGVTELDTSLARVVDEIAGSLPQAH